MGLSLCAERARAYAKRLGAGLAIVDKRRSQETGAAEVMNVVGDVEGRTCILQDDIVDTAAFTDAETISAAADIQAFLDLQSKVELFDDTEEALTNQQKLGVKVFIYSDVETKYLDMYVSKFKHFKPDFVGSTEQAGIAKLIGPGQEQIKRLATVTHDFDAGRLGEDRAGG